MVARSRPHEAVAMTPRVEAMGVGAISKNHTFEEREDVVQEPLLSTTTAASSMIASLSSAEEEEDDDVRVQDGESEDADDEGSDEDHLFILSEEEKRATPIVDAPEQTPQDGPENDANKGKDEDHTSSEEETPAENVKRKASPPQAPRFSLISIPRRVRASVFARRPKASPQPILLEHDATLEDKEKVSDESTERESMLTTPASADGGLPLPSLTSIASITRSLSFRSDDQVVTPADKVEKFKSFWDEKLRMTMDRIAHRSKIDAGAAEYERERDELDVFHLLLKLYAHQDVVEELYASYDANASDFEFYIPQLCTFYIHGNYEKQHQLECFLMSRSGESLAFAHRLSWFLKSFCNDARSYQSEYLSVTSSPEEENADLLIAIQQRGGVPAVLMEQGLNIEEVVERGPNVMLRRASSFDIDAAAQATIPRTASVAEDDETFTTYLQDKRQVLMYEAKPEEGNDQQVALYNATPNFVKALTDLADRLIPLPLAQRNEELRRGLTEIAAVSLPSNVIYLPIGNTYHRVKSIQIEECFTFSTKERVPYFLCVEVIDYVTERRASDPKKARRSLLNRRRSRSKSRKFGLNLRFKKNRESLSEMPRSDGSLCDTRNSTKPQNLAEVQDLLNGLHDGEYPNELLYEEESKTNEEPDSSKTTPYDLFGEMRVIFAITPEKASLTDAEVATRMNEGADGDDEKEACSESAADTDQKKRMGQWGLPRVRRRGKQPRPSAPKTSSKFDNFYSAWFAKKQKDEPLVAQNANADIPEIVSTDTHIHEESPTEGGNQCDIDTTEPLPEPKSEEPPKPATENMKPKRRGRDISISLDFTDADAWKLNFELEDVLTDADLETANDTDAPEVTPEADQEMVDDSEESEDEKPVIVFRERWSEKEERIRRESPHGDHPGWRLLPVIVKSNDDLRQEQFAAQLIAQCDRIFKEYSLPLRLRPYHIIATSAKCGLIEAVPNTVSLDSLKRNDPHYTTLLDFYQRLFGTDTTEFRHARRNFVESLAAYSILCYVFQIKDRHNGNILIDTDGHVIHIDFGFLLTNSPGSNLNFERAPFKLTDEFVQLMGGPRSAAFRYFRSLCIRAYLALRRNMDKIILLVEMMLVGNEDLPCFAGGKRAVIEGLRDRLKPGARTSECQLYVNQLIDRSINNWRTRWYDKYQRAWVGIL